MPNPLPSLPAAPGPDDTLADLATQWAGASRVFQRHGLDFCCQGGRSLAAACAQKGLDATQVLAELQATLAAPARPMLWDELPTGQLVAHVIDRYHAGHRRELPRLLQMAQRVERVHGQKPDCPRGLADHLAHLAGELEQHMQKEERVLFPLLLAGADLAASGPIQCLTAEHDEHGRNLARLRELAHGFTPPPAACGTWRALYLGLAELEHDLMEHVHLENHVLFPRAIAPGA